MFWQFKGNRPLAKVRLGKEDSKMHVAPIFAEKCSKPLFRLSITNLRYSKG